MTALADTAWTRLHAWPIPAVIHDMPDHVYHADPVPGGSLSSSGARRLLEPSCPAKFAWERENGRPEKRAFDFGHAAHLLALGTGPEVVVVDADDWRTKAAREERDAAYQRGAVPLLAEEWGRAQDMAKAIRDHGVAADLLNPDHGSPEVSLFWHDDIWRRARLDWLPHPGQGRLLVPDYKTCKSANPRAIERAVVDYGYHQQAAWYLDGLAATGVSDDAVFLFVFQEIRPPHLVAVHQLDAAALITGRNRNRRAVDLYQQCTTTGHWPGYADDEIGVISLPPWAEDLETP